MGKTEKKKKEGIQEGIQNFYVGLEFQIILGTKRIFRLVFELLNTV
jgi:hypothetical protein